MHPNRSYSQKLVRGFTLVELLVVIAIIAVLAALIFSVVSRAMLKGKQTACVSLMRNVEIGMEAYLIEQNRPPLPKEKTQGGHDTLFGDPGGKYSTAPLMAVLMGGDDLTWEEQDSGNTFDINYLNPKGVEYLTLTVVSGNEAGLREDGKVYDPWNRELMIGVNSRLHDDPLNTWGFAEWNDAEPDTQEFVMWSYGADGEHGKGASHSFRGSDDVKSF